jgi:hypothetical protein
MTPDRLAFVAAVIIATVLIVPQVAALAWYWHRKRTPRISPEAAEMRRRFRETPYAPEQDEVAKDVDGAALARFHIAANRAMEFDRETRGAR